MQFPYGVSDFQSIIQDDLFYIDRTHLIPDVERAGRQIIFLRPRRFGKSLWLSTLENYYDINKADKFESLFGHLAIGRNPTPLHNRYLIMRWDFSNVTAQGSAEDVAQKLHNHINRQIVATSQKYQDLLRFSVHIDSEDAISSFESLLSAINNSNLKLYLLIDEYDNFANELMMGDGDSHYQTLLHGEGAVRAVFKAVKAGSAGMGLERVFITGVSPIAMSDITSAYNVASNIYLLPQFNQLCGFTEPEITDVVQRIVEEQGLHNHLIDDAMHVMRTFYNGYRFCKQPDVHMYNPTMALYFLRYFSDQGIFPEQVLDENLAMDTRKIHYIAKLAHGTKVIGRALDDSQPLVISSISERFGVRRMVEHTQDREGLLSLLYYLGALTHTTTTRPGKVALRIPNLVMRKLYIEEVQATLLPDFHNEDNTAAIEALYTQANIAPLCTLLEQSLFSAFSNRDYRWSDEFSIKIAFLATLFNDVLFIMDSEPELNRGYADLSMMVRPDMRHYDIYDVLMEFKFIKPSLVGMTGQQAAQADEQVLHNHPVVVDAFEQAETQLQRYIPALQDQYGQAMKLCVFAVVAVGFERLLWRSISIEGESD